MSFMFRINGYGLFFGALLAGILPLNSFAQDAQPLELEPIEVTKSRVHLLSGYSLGPESFFPVSALEALSALPIDLQSRSPKGGIQTDFSLRASSFQGVLVAIDSKRVNDPQTGHHNADIPVTREDIEALEVIPGAGSSLFGPDAIGGVVNIRRKKPRAKAMVFETGIGQYQSGWGLLSISEKKENFGLRVSVENNESAGFYEDTDFKKFTAAIASLVEFPDARLDFNFGYQEKEFGAFDFYTPGSGYLSKEWTKTYLTDLDLNVEKGSFTFRPSFLWRRHFDKFALDKTTVRSRYLNHHYTDIYLPGIYIRKEDSLLGTCGAGVEYTQESINSTNLGKHTRSRKSVILDNSKDLTQELSLGTALRVDDFYSFGRAYSGQIALRQNLSRRASIFAGASRNIREPSFTELYYNDPVTLGNAYLSEEKALNYQIGYDYKSEFVSTGVNLFLRREDDFIDWIKRDSSKAKWQVENISGANVAGLEAYLNLPLSEGLEFNSNYSYVDKRLYDNGYLYKYGPNYLRHLLNCGLNFQAPQGEQGLGFTYKKKPRRDGWLLVNTHLSYNLKKSCKLFLNVSNLFNVEYQEIEGIPQPGRWIESGVRFEW